MRIAILGLLIGMLLSACATDEKSRPSLSNPERVTQLNLVILPDNLESIATPEQRRQLTETISANLSSLGYPVKPAAPKQEILGYALEGKIGKVEKKATPPGFTLDFGNSDPRALDFQKANVVPVSCLLRSPNKTEKPVKLTGEFSVPADIDELIGAPNKPVSLNFFADRLGTVCLNLLAELNIPKTGQTAGVAPWKPTVDVEIRDKPVSPSVVKPSSPPVEAPYPASVGGKTPNAVDLSAPPVGGSLGGGQSKSSEAPAPKKPASQAEAVNTETRVNPEDQRKQMIIHNQGTPIILEFGYDRQ